jgi:hypothetical protein
MSCTDEVSARQGSGQSPSGGQNAHAQVRERERQQEEPELAGGQQGTRSPAVVPIGVFPILVFSW